MALHKLKLSSPEDPLLFHSSLFCLNREESLLECLCVNFCWKQTETQKLDQQTSSTINFTKLLSWNYMVIVNKLIWFYQPCNWLHHPHTDHILTTYRPHTDHYTDHLYRPYTDHPSPPTYRLDQLVHNYHVHIKLSTANWTVLPYWPAVPCTLSSRLYSNSFLPTSLFS